MYTGKIHLEPHCLHREVGHSLNLFSVKILSLLHMRFSGWESLFFKKNIIFYIFMGFCSVLWSCHFVIFFTLGNFRPWGAHAHAKSWTRETKKNKPFKVILERNASKMAAGILIKEKSSSDVKLHVYFSRLPFRKLKMENAIFISVFFDRLNELLFFLSLLIWRNYSSLFFFK